MNKKQKGTKAERELIKMFDSVQWAAFRAAGSGSMRLPCPDVIAGNVVRKLGIECKSTKGIKQYLTKKEVDELKDFCTRFGAEPWIGVRFDNLSWYFLTLEDLQETEENYVISIALAKRRGLEFGELVNKI